MLARLSKAPTGVRYEVVQTWMYAQAVRTNVDRYVKANLETDFDTHEFLEGAKDAFHTGTSIPSQLQSVLLSHSEGIPSV